MAPRRDDDRERRSWRDIDRGRDSSSHIDRSNPYAKKGHGRKGPAAPSSGYKSALDKFFDGGELPDKFKGLARSKSDLGKGGGSERQGALKRLREAVLRDEVEAATKVILDMDGELPEDAEVLLAVLRHPDEEIVRDAMTVLKKVAMAGQVKRKELLKQRLQQVADLAEDDDTVDLADAVRRVI